MTRLMNYRSKRRVKGIGLHLRPWSRGIVVRVAYSRLGELNSSEDIAQQTFVTAWNRKSDLKVLFYRDV